MVRIEVGAKTLREIKHSQYFRLKNTIKTKYDGFLLYDEFYNEKDALGYLENLSKSYYNVESERLNNFKNKSLKLGDCIAKIVIDPCEGCNEYCKY